jgi:predicted enzyme related to lactoylglutathione lyase
MDGGIRYWLADTGDGDRGINGAISDRQLPGQHTINTIGVASIDAAIDAVLKAGGTVTGKIDDIPNIGRFTYAFDTEGNAFGILEPLPGT